MHVDFIDWNTVCNWITNMQGDIWVWGCIFGFISLYVSEEPKSKSLIDLSSVLEFKSVVIDWCIVASDFHVCCFSQLETCE